MSLITCCPACGTMFKVVPDQLRISEGWVRCGHCAEIFDATAHLQQPQTQSQPQPVAEEMVQPLPVAEEMGQPEPVAASVDEPPLEAAGDSSASMPVPPLEPPVQVAEAGTGYPPFEFVRADQGEASASGYEAVTGTSAEPTDFPEETDSQLDDLGFVRKARRKAFWRRPAVRVLLVASALVLAALLALQWGLHERDRLAAVHPPLRPLLAAACEPLGCEVGAPRQIEAIVIDSSTFNRLRTDAYRLSFTLKNQGAVQVALPALELTLTDTQDQPVVRRVVLPEELGAAGRVIEAGSEWSGNLALTVAANGSTGRIAGYRLLAFYP